MKMRKTLMFLTVCILMLTAPALTLSAPYLVCNPQAVGVDNYRVEISGPVIVTQDVTPDPNGIYGFVLDLSPLNIPDGSYTVRANATNMWGTSEWSTEYPFVKSATEIPANIRLVPSP